MNKRGQITLFVIAGILIVVAVGIFVLFRSGTVQIPITSEQADKIVATQAASVRSYVEGCMEITVTRTLNTLGRQGGYIWPRSSRYSVPYEVFPDSPAMSYALFKEDNQYKSFFPTLSEIKGEFISVMEGNPDFDSCINNFNSFRKTVDVSAGEMKIDNSTIDFGEKSGQIVIDFTYPLTLTKQDATTLVDDYSISIPINLAKIHENALLIMNQKASGKSVTVIMQDQAKSQEQALRQSPNAETMFLSSRSYEMMSTGGEGKVFNLQNTLFTIEYSNPLLENPYNFYFLTGE